MYFIVRKYLFVCPRFHTNQVALVEQLKKQGDEVVILAEYQTKLENHLDVSPLLIKQAFLSRLWIKMVHFITSKEKEDLTYRYFFSSRRYIKQSVANIKPDVVIVRDQLFNSIAWASALKHKKNILVIDYNQRPLWHEKERSLKDKLFKYRNHFLPKLHYTPVYQRSYSGAPLIQAKNTAFIPFVVRFDDRPQVKSDVMRILDVGKYRCYKNHKLLVKAFSQITDKDKYHITIVGQKLDKQEHQYFSELEAMIDQLQLKPYFTLVCNVPNREMKEYYFKHDVLILPSTRELASYAILEAMSYKLAVISSNNNGTAWYVKEAQCGELFETKNEKSLINAIEKVRNNNYHLLGEAGYAYVEKNCHIDIFNAAIDRFATLPDNSLS